MDINRREPLTAKARKGVILFVRLRMKGRNGKSGLEDIVSYVLQAERMTRERLYNALRKRG